MCGLSICVCTYTYMHVYLHTLLYIRLIYKTSKLEPIVIQVFGIKMHAKNHYNRNS